MTTDGWGAGPWGAMPWGAGGVGALAMLSALAVAENVVRVTFNTAPQFDELLGPNDASNPERWAITPIAGTSGMDGLPARPVTPVIITLAPVRLSFGAVLDVTIDRPFSPWPSRYIVAAHQLVAAGTLTPLDPGATSQGFDGVYRILRVPATDTILPSRDIANPQTYAAELDPLPQAGDPLILGVIPIDASGDYAFDDGITNLKKRVFRRLVTRPGAIAALPRYGVGIPAYGKRLSQAGIRQQIVALIERQVSLEPDVVAVSAKAASDPRTPSVVVFTIKVKSATAGLQTFQFAFSAV